MSQDGSQRPLPPPTPAGPPLSPPAPTGSPPTAVYSTPPAVPSGDREPGNRARAVVIAAIVALLALAGVVVFLLTRDGDDDDSTIPPATEQPDGLGDDEGFDALAQDCFDGDMAACDELYNLAEDDSAYRRYGDTCAGRQPEGTRQFCATAFTDE